MMRKGVVSVALHDVAGHVVSDARVELDGQLLSFDERLGVYVSKPVEPGQYTLAVYVQGFESQEVSLRLNAPGLSTSLVLGRPGQPYYVAGGRRVYFEVGERPHAAMAETFGDAVPIESPARRGRFLSRFIEVIVEKDVARERLEKVIRPFGLRVYSQDGLDPTIFKVESEDVLGPEFGAVPERLARLPEIRSAMSIISAIDESTQFVPQDTLFPLQFHAWVTRVPEAWDRVDPARTDTSFGSADVIVAVTDTGIDLRTGHQHCKFAGTVTGGTLSTQPGLTNRKVLFSYDFSNPAVRPNMDTGPNAPTDQHGSCVSGIILQRSPRTYLSIRLDRSIHHELTATSTSRDGSRSLD
jgi:hypothetical protein